MRFTKMQGIGNDYVYVNCFEETVDNPGEVAKRVSDRHFGIGSDGLILIKPSKVADFEMDMYNSDGSRGAMCGNGIRCVAKYVYDYGLTDKTSISIDTASGIKYLDLTIEDGKAVQIRVNMGAPILEAGQIPILREYLLKEGDTPKTIAAKETANAENAQERIVAKETAKTENVQETTVIAQPILVDGNTYLITGVSMGNPHAVTYIEDVKGLDIEKIGPKFEHHPCFPDRVNTEFVRVLDRKTVEMRVWERGAGETMACGTGACAVAVASILNGYTEDEVTVKLLGGDLKIYWDRKENLVYMTGPAEVVFEGTI